MTRTEAKRWQDSPDPGVREAAARVLAGRARVMAKSLPRRKDEAVEAESKADEDRRVRAACVERSAGHCEACGADRGPALHHDHFWGRGRDRSVEGSWMLCPPCDTKKTENVGGRLAWLLRFGLHVQIYAYGHQLAKVERHVGLERAQHPATEVP